MKAMYLPLFIAANIFSLGCSVHRTSLESSGVQLRDKRNSSTTGCLDDWLRFGQKCYAAFGENNSGQLTWTVAASVCRDRYGGNLVSIHSKEEQDFLVNTFLTLPPISAWIGLNDRKLKNVYEWDDHSALDYTYWGPGQPSEPRHGEEDCIELRYFLPWGTIGKWNDASCGEQRPYICQLTTALTSTPPSKYGVNSSIQGENKNTSRDVKRCEDLLRTVAVTGIICSTLVLIILIAVATYRGQQWRKNRRKSLLSFVQFNNPSPTDE